MSYVIESRGSQGNGARVIDLQTGTVKHFTTHREARAYADAIAPDEPSKNLPLVVVKVDGCDAVPDTRDVRPDGPAFAESEVCAGTGDHAGQELDSCDECRPDLYDHLA